LREKQTAERKRGGDKTGDEVNREIGPSAASSYTEGDGEKRRLQESWETGGYRQRKSYRNQKESTQRGERRSRNPFVRFFTQGRKERTCEDVEQGNNTEVKGTQKGDEKKGRTTGKKSERPFVSRLKPRGTRDRDGGNREIKRKKSRQKTDPDAQYHFARWIADREARGVKSAERRLKK